MLKCENIHFSYDKSKKFIKNLNIDIPKSKITTILGPNGSGKSTLLSMLARFNRPLEGNVFIENTNLSTLKFKEIAQRIETVHQHNESPEDITVEKLVSFGRVP
ncbi:ATP-binding cassette domain-containing protein, partial [Terrisporobacter sp.]|uniref:ATP-binding cassette domain-containing protein n=1 Tax=Terrisporobacter sp. TaxID=1965305 RepID=UPI0026395908